MLIRKKWITREDVRANPDKLYVFGDNMLRVGMGGQAGAMRGEPNALGIPTKWNPTMEEDAFFRPDMTEEQSKQLREVWASDLMVIWNHLDAGKDVVVPFDGLGTGLSKLPEYHPEMDRFLKSMFTFMGQKYSERVED